MITVHIVDDHKMLVEGLCGSINESGTATVTGTSYTLAACRKALSAQVPDVLLLDLGLPDGSGIDFCVEVRKKYPSVKVVVLTTHDEYSTAKRMLDSGASGYILKTALLKEVVAGIETVVGGETFLGNEVDVLMQRQPESKVWLTVREQELLRLIAGGYTNKEIAEKVFLSVETIKTYHKNLNLKIGAKNPTQLVKIATEKKLI